MAAIQISDELDAELQLVADQLGRTKDDLVQEALTARLEEKFTTHSDLSDQQIARMKHSLAQLDHNETVTGEHVDKKFENWRTAR